MKVCCSRVYLKGQYPLVTSPWAKLTWRISHRHSSFLKMFGICEKQTHTRQHSFVRISR